MSLRRRVGADAAWSSDAHSTLKQPDPRQYPQMSGESSTQMQVDKPQKLDVEVYLSTTQSTAPVELHSFIESFRTLYRRKYVRCCSCRFLGLICSYLTKAMASAHTVRYELFRPPLIQTISSRCVRAFRARVRDQDQPAHTGPNGCQCFERIRWYAFQFDVMMQLVFMVSWFMIQRPNCSSRVPHISVVANQQNEVCRSVHTIVIDFSTCKTALWRSPRYQGRHG